LKKLLTTLALSMLFCSVATASPLTNFSQGKGSIDLTFRNTQDTIMGIDELDCDATSNWPKKNNFDGTVTYSLNSRFAVQYRNFASKSETYHSDNNWFTELSSGNLKITTNEFNILYKLNKNTDAFVGWVGVKGKYQDLETSEFSGIFHAKNYYQLGVVTSTAIADKTILWGSAAVGNKLENYEAGVGYQISPALEFNVDYRYLKSKGFSFNDGNSDELSNLSLMAKGLGFGLTYKY